MSLGFIFVTLCGSFSTTSKTLVFAGINDTGDELLLLLVVKCGKFDIVLCPGVSGLVSLFVSLVSWYYKFGCCGACYLFTHTELGGGQSTIRTTLATDTVQCWLFDDEESRRRTTSTQSVCSECAVVGDDDDTRNQCTMTEHTTRGC